MQPTQTPFALLPAVTPVKTAKIDGPDLTTIEVIASAQGAKGTRINVTSAFTTDGSTPVLPGGAGSGYVIGDAMKYQAVAPRFLASGDIPARPYTLKVLVKAQNVVVPGDIVSVLLNAIVGASVDHVTGLTPIVQVQKTKTILPVTSGPVTTIDGTRTVKTTTYIKDIRVNDPVSFQVVTRVEGPPGSVGIANLHTVTSMEPDPPPTLPSYSAPFSGSLQVGKNAEVQSVITGAVFRDGMVSRKLYAKIRAIDEQNTNIVHVAELELNIIAAASLTAFNVLVKRNTDIFQLEDLALVGGARQLQAGDPDSVEVLLQPVGDPGSQAVVRGSFTLEADNPPALDPIANVVTYDPSGRPLISNTNGFLGIFDTDKKAGFIPVGPASEFRTNNGTRIHCFVDATSTISVANTISKTFDLEIVVPVTLTGLSFFYVNSRNPDAVLPIQAGTDVNGTITGSGTSIDPFVIPVDKPEQLQVFAVPNQTKVDAQAWVQTGYAFNQDAVDVIFPTVPEAWKRAFTRDNKINVIPNPVPPGTPAKRPPTGGELIIATGGTLAGDPGSNPGYSNLIQCYARGQTVENSDNFKEATVWIKVADPAVL